MRKIKVVVLLVRQLQHGFTKNAKVSPNLTVTHLVSGGDRQAFVASAILEHGDKITRTTEAFNR